MLPLTISGLDINTCLESFAKLPVEAGILYSANPKTNRYPSLEWIRSALEVLPCAAVHLCGTASRKQALAGELDDVIEGAGRVQVNGWPKPQEVIELCERFPNTGFITQFGSGHRKLLKIECSNHMVLVDASGGNGVSPEHWEDPAPHKRVGFAGGLGPHNLEQELPRVMRAAREGWWVDMEAKVRDESDWLDMDKVRQVIQIVESALS